MTLETISLRWWWTSGLLLLSAAIVLSPETNQVLGQSSSKVSSDSATNDLAQLLLQRLLGEASASGGGKLEDRQSIEDTIFSSDGASVIFPQVKNKEAPIRRYLDEAKDQLDVIDFRHQPTDQSETVIRQPRRKPKPVIPLDLEDEDELQSGEEELESEKLKAESASEQVTVRLAFPGNDYVRDTRAIGKSCTNCIDGEFTSDKNRWTMPLQKLGEKQYYLGIFFKANWYKSEQYCRFHGMHLASVNSAEEQKSLEEHIQAYGLGQDHFWTSGTDQAEEGKFFWLSTGRPITYTNWNAGEPNNFQYEDGEQEHCLEMWDRDGKGMGWNDTPCSFETFFICEV